ncbi:hypothetical protein FGO68_gene17801 [Halteria grandinella]|uniref:Uncharacterized protein n=1 Tax=Halteria grandinella TaxID=5974 RepID=A0A8J8NYT2_HALGN|nr:hypothetical protein FGO68_gene17801 [Halteria grandinella]
MEIPYPQTSFEMDFYKPTFNKIRTAYKRYPDLFKSNNDLQIQDPSLCKINRYQIGLETNIQIVSLQQK